MGSWIEKFVIRVLTREIRLLGFGEDRDNTQRESSPAFQVEEQSQSD